MAKVMTAAQLVQKAKDAATIYKTLYVLGGWGAPLNAQNKQTYIKKYAYNAQPFRKQKINAATADTFAFDCVCMIKGFLWGWTGNIKSMTGGAIYASNGVPDLTCEAMIAACSNVSTNFSNVQPGELLWMQGHVGIAIEDGLAVECSPAWKDGAQITAIGNIGAKKGYNTRTWTKHGKMPWVDYSAPQADPFPGVSNEELARRVWAGEFGGGATRKAKLGIRYAAVQALVDKGIGRFSVGEKVKLPATTGTITKLNGTAATVTVEIDTKKIK